MTEKDVLSVTEFYSATLTNVTEVLVDLDYEDNFVDNLHVVIYIIIGKTSYIKEFRETISCFVRLMSAVWSVS